MHPGGVMSRVLHLMGKRPARSRPEDKDHSNGQSPGSGFHFTPHTNLIVSVSKNCVNYPRGRPSQSKASFARPRTPASQSSTANSRNRFSADRALSRPSPKAASALT